MQVTEQELSQAADASDFLFVCFGFVSEFWVCWVSVLLCLLCFGFLVFGFVCLFLMEIWFYSTLVTFKKNL